MSRLGTRDSTRDLKALTLGEEFTNHFTTLHQTQHILTWGHSLPESSGPISQAPGADSLRARVPSPVAPVLQGGPNPADKLQGNVVSAVPVRLHKELLWNQTREDPQEGSGPRR